MPPAMLVHVPETGSKISAELVAPPPDTVPPATRTRPSCKVAEIWLLRGLFIGAARGETDPSELKNLAGTKAAAAVEQELKGALEEWMILQRDFLPLPVPPRAP